MLMDSTLFYSETGKSKIVMMENVLFFGYGGIYCVWIQFSENEYTQRQIM